MADNTQPVNSLIPEGVDTVKDQTISMFANILYILTRCAKLFFGKVEPRVCVIVMEDNKAVIKITLKGRSKALPHVNRTHRVNIDWLPEFFRMPNVHVKYVNTRFQLADIFI